MALASIIISQPANPIPVGVAGRARQDLLLGMPVVLSNANDDGVVAWRWRLDSVPIGSSATLSSPTGASTQFVPDVQGTYRFTLSVNGAAAGETQTRIGAVLDPAGFRFPSIGELGPEANYDLGGDENREGWGRAVEAILRGVKSASGFSANSTNVTAGLGSTTFTVIGLWYPTADADIDLVDWIDYRGTNVGSRPIANNIFFNSFTSIDYGIATVSAITQEVDTGACAVGDEWAYVIKTTAEAILIPVRVILV